LITEENNDGLGNIGTAGGAEDVSDPPAMAVDDDEEGDDEEDEEEEVAKPITVTERMKAILEQRDDEEDEGEEAASSILGGKREKALVEKIKASKTIDVEDIVSRWESTLLDIPDDFHLDQLQHFVRLRQSVPVAWCINHCDNTAVESFVPAYLTRISNSQWEVNDKDDLVMQHLDYEGD
jgi:hypothetical protein